MFVRETAAGPLIVTSASDLTAASACEFAFLRRVDEKLGRAVLVPADDDPMLARAGALGDVHEEAELARLRSAFGDGLAGEPGGVVMIPRPESMDPDALEQVASLTQDALHGCAEIVFQATFFDPAQRPRSAENEPAIGFIGFADFLALLPSGEYEVQDTKLARRAKVTALMQLAAYAEQLERIGVPVAREATLILGSGERSTHRIDDIAPVFRKRRARLHEILLERFGAVGDDGTRESASPIGWDDEGIAMCGRCEVCEPEVVRTRDPLLIAGVTLRQRNALRAAGLTTLDAVAVQVDQIEQSPAHGMTSAVFHRLALQAAVQVAAESGAPPPFRVIAPHELAAIPLPNPGDLFFDFEGDPFYRETGDDGIAKWNLDYLFGMVDDDESFTPIWAHSLSEEREALKTFIALVRERRRRFPGMRIYHYASYERTHLLSIAARHGVCEAEVDELLREHVLVDLYPIVRRALRVGSRSYSIKKLEPLYMGAELRDEAGVTSGAQSVVEFAEASEQLRSGLPEVKREGQLRLDAIADYNKYDCLSTLRLRDWLLDIAREYAVEPFQAAVADRSEDPPIELSAIGAELLSLADVADEPAARTALKLASSAIDYHSREQKSFWWAHFARQTDPIEDWADTRDVVVVEPEASYVEEDWHKPYRARSEKRTVRLTGTIAPGSSLKPGTQVFAMYDLPAPFPHRGEPGARASRQVRIVERHDDGVTIEESLGNAPDRFDRLPIAITPGPPPNAGQQKPAIEHWGRQLAATATSGVRFRDPVYELLTRAKPMLSGGDALVDPQTDEALRSGGDEEHRVIGAVTSSLLRLDHSSLAVQGPPGTGKTYLAARVIRMLVESHGWRVGVVAQSHKVVENVLEAVVRAGLEPSRVAKVPQGGKLEDDAQAPGYSVLRANGHARFLHEHEGVGAVIGGTAWDFAHPDRVARRSLDLLVIDEAGQFSLAPTIAASVSATRLLLLGDQQQLPQVSQGAHPEPVDMSALSWLLGDHETMPDGYGYFLADTRRMHPALSSVVSELSYEHRLRSHPSTLLREVVAQAGEGPEPGLHWFPVEHTGNATSSSEEADEIAHTVRQLLAGGLTLRQEIADGGELLSRPIEARDIIVVAAYNAQVECVSDALRAAGFGEIRVGTVDRFQGQEAVFSLVSLAASSAEDVPRGLEFLLMRNRLNVAISRAQWASYLFSSPWLGDGLPTSAEGLSALSGYLRLTERAHRDAGE